MFKKYKGISPKQYRNQAYRELPIKDEKPTIYCGGII